MSQSYPIDHIIETLLKEKEKMIANGDLPSIWGEYTIENIMEG